MSTLDLTRTINGKKVMVVLANVNFFEFGRGQTTIHFTNGSNIDVSEDEQSIKRKISK